MKLTIALLTLFFSALSFAQEEPEIPVAEQLKDSCQVYIPNVSGIIHHTINAINAPHCLEYRWGVYSNCELQDFELRVFNRWGEMVYESYKQEERWDGVGMVDGVYVYVLKYKNENDETRRYKGYLTLLK